MFRAVNTNFRASAEIPSGPLTYDEESQAESSHSSRLHQIFTPLETYRNDADGSYEFHGEAAVDIIAVHGLAGSYSTSWSVEEKDGNQYHWLKEKLPKDIPIARILNFEYDSEWYADPSHVDLDECGAQLLRAIVQDRRHQGELAECPSRRKRPIIFIGHSFGGLVIKQALLYASQTHGGANVATRGANPSIRAAEYRNNLDLLACTAGIIFLGTPHRGSNFSWLAKAKMRAGSVVGYSTNPDLIDLLNSDSPLLTHVRKAFTRLQHSDKLNNLQLYCYFEQKEMDLVKMVVVSQDSACLPGAQVRGLPLNHKELNKFQRGEDKNYNSLLADILEVVKVMSDIVLPRFEAWQYNSDGCNDVRESLRCWLTPSRDPQERQLHSRLAVQTMSSYTCQWIFDLPAFKSWKDWTTAQNLLWINGKAGSGKSVLAAFLISHFRGGVKPSQDKDREGGCNVPLVMRPCGYWKQSVTVLYFFCGIDRMHEDPKSFLGTLIHQLLWWHSEDQQLLSICEGFRKRNRAGADAKTMSKLLGRLVDIIGNVIIIVDGLEEAIGTIPSTKDAGVGTPSESIEAYNFYIDHLSFVKGLRTARLVFLCQGVEGIHRKLHEVFGSLQIVSITENSRPDMEKFVDIEVVKLIKAKPEFIAKEQDLIIKLRQNAGGVFQWVSASIDLLKDVKLVEDIDKSLEDLPQGLTWTYSRMFERVSRMSDDRRLRVATALKWLAVSARPLTALELKTAMMLDDKKIDIEEIKEWIGKSVYDHAQLAEDLRGLLDDLIQIDELEDGTHTVQPAHPALRKALISNAPTKQAAITAFMFTVEEAHQCCALACMKLVQVSTFANANAFGVSQTPLVEYAWELWVYHLRLSSLKLNNEVVMNLFDALILNVTLDAVAFLDALTDFASSPLEPVPGVEGDLAYIVSLQHAQEAIFPALKALDSVRSKTPLSFKLAEEGVAISQLRYQANPATLMHEYKFWIQRRLTQFRVNVLKTESAVMKLRTDAYMTERPHMQALVSQFVRDLWDAAQKLRLVALRFAVNPVYGALIAKAGGTTFSPIHCLVYIAALLEESANYPYWSDYLPVNFDIMDSFICEPQDPFAGAARFVLHSFEYRYPKLEEAKPEIKEQRPVSPEPQAKRRRTRSHSPRPDPRDVGAYQTISADDRRRAQQLQEIPGDKWITAVHGHELFKVKDGSFLEVIVNPIRHIHLQEVMLLKSDKDLPLYVPNMSDPTKTLMMHAPKSLATAPLTQYLRSLPANLRLQFVRCYAYVIEIFGHLSKHALALHFWRFEVAKQEFLSAIEYGKRTLDPQDPAEMWHLVPGLFLFWLRCRFMPWYGAHHLPHPWAEFLYSYKHPAAYLNWQDEMTWWRWTKWIFGYLIANSLSVAFLTNGLTLPKSRTRHASNIMGSFSLFCQIERSIFTICFVCATLLASARIIFIDQESAARVAKFSFYYWINTFFGIGVTCIHMGVSNYTTNPLHVIVSAISQLAITVVWLIYSPIIFRYLGVLLYSSVYIAYLPFWLVAQAAIHSYVPVMKVTSIIIFMYVGFLAMHWMSRWLWDPYDMKSSLHDLTAARRIARLILKPEDKKRIGTYPLGEIVDSASNGNEASKSQDSETTSRGGFRLLVRAPTLERSKTDAVMSATETTGSNPMDGGVYPKVTPGIAFKSFFGPSALPRSKSPRRAYPTDAINNSGMPSSREGKHELVKPEPEEHKPEMGEPEITPEELFQETFSPNGIRDSRSRTRSYDDFGSAGSGHLKKE
ncbi:hypothetical protein V492_00596 [Pseudogymnoascus sp. VKM F-4246]|nr:hypothetical protein V492_00596 [Pseudogymnoascus sp. VKM F-4246]